MRKTVLLLLLLAIRVVSAWGETGDNPYGVCAHLAHAEIPYSRATLEKMKASGMGWLRTDFTTAMIRPSSNRWDFSRWDKVMDDAAATGITVLPMFGYHAPWATPAWDHPESYVEFLTNTLNRYRGRFPVVEIWNEVDGRWNEKFGGEQMARAAADYVRLLKASYLAVKAFDPTVKVAIAGFAGVHPGKMRAIYRAGAKGWFDIMNIHPYTNPRPPEGELERLLAETRQVMAEFDDEAKPVWATELGWSTPKVSMPTPGIVAASLAELAAEGFETKRIACVDVYPDGKGKKMFAALRDEFLRNPGAEVTLVPAGRLAADLASGRFDVVAFPPNESYAVDSFPAVVEFVKRGGIVVIVGGTPFAYRMIPDGKGCYVREKGTNGFQDAAKLRIFTRCHHHGREFPPYGGFVATDIRLASVRPKGRFGGGSMRYLRRDLLKDGDRLVPMMSRMNGTDELVGVGTYRYGDMKGAVIIDGTVSTGIGSSVTWDEQASYTVRGNLITAFSGIEKTFVYEFASTEREPYYGEAHFGLHRLDLRDKPAAQAYRTMTRMRPAGSVNASGTWRREGFYFPKWCRPDGHFAGALWSVGDIRSHRLVAEKGGVRFVGLTGEAVAVSYADGAYEVPLSDTPVYWMASQVGESGVGVWPEVKNEACPWAYNWWMGSAVDEEGLRLQVSEMKRVGIGGFHVIPIYSTLDASKDKTFLSSEWMRAFGGTVRIAKEYGLGVDLTMGSGWCFGGPQIADEDGAWTLEVNAKELDKSVVLWRGTNDAGEVVLSIRPTGQRVKRAGPGGSGLMMNPFSASAMGRFLAPFTDAFDAPNALKPQRMYHDSYEYYDANWSDELPEAFAKRRGYRIEDHYAELAGVGDQESVRRVKCDYRETLSEVLVEDVFSQWTDWCRARGISTRNEAHGAPANWLDFYALADIPETEMFGCDKARARDPEVTAGFMNSGDRDILVSKFASSAAHVKHAGARRDPLVSAEGGTWTCEHFCETLGSVKTFVDRLFLAGVNHLFYHGTCYSPADAKWPGWTFYAACEMNRFNPIWHDMDILNRYVARVQSVAQSEAIDNDILVYWPLHDLWMDAEGFEKQMTVHDRDWLENQPVGKNARRLLDDGYAFDFISERQLASLPSTTGRQAFACGRYTTIVVPEAKAMKPETFAGLLALAGKGYAVLFVGGFPTTVPGWKDVAARETELKRLVAESVTAQRFRAGTYEELLPLAPVRREPFDRAHGLAYTRHAADGVTTYFISNQYRDDGVKGFFKPASPCQRAELWDPMTGEMRGIEVCEGAVELDLPIGHSIILKVFSETAAVGCAHKSRVTTERTIPITETWTRMPVAGGPQFPDVVSGRLPLPWGDVESFPESAFCGTMRYETSFVMDAVCDEDVSRMVLDLGRIEQSAKVFVNGSYAAGVILPPYRVTIPMELVVSGTNTLAVEVTSTGANRLRWLDMSKPYPWKIFTDINMVDINYKSIDASTWKRRMYGLFGPVVLTVGDTCR